VFVIGHSGSVNFGYCEGHKEVQVTQLRQQMLEELQRRNYSQTTVSAYLKTVEEFAKHFHRPPDQLGPDEIRAYQVYLLQGRKQGVRTVGHHTAALRFFFCKTLKRNYPVEEVPYPRAPRRLPIILTQEEAVRLIDSASNLFHRTMLMTLYSTGMRRAEMCHLKVEDIDSVRMLIHIRHGKRNRDRDVPLSPKLLETLREYWRWMHPKTYLFPGTENGWRADKPITPKVLWEACREAAQRAGITKSVRPHLIRHASAYYTTFQSSFILKAIALDQAELTAVYGRNGRLGLALVRLAGRGLFDR
jgi:integrase/recombinase XerD